MMITTSCHCVLIDACAAPCTSRQSKSMHMCLMRRSTESSSARGGLVSCTRNKNITCFPSANAHVGPARSSITLAFEARLARDAWSHQFEELRAVPRCAKPDQTPHVPTRRAQNYGPVHGQRNARPTPRTHRMERLAHPKPLVNVLVVAVRSTLSLARSLGH